MLNLGFGGDGMCAKVEEKMALLCCHVFSAYYTYICSLIHVVLLIRVVCDDDITYCESEPAVCIWPLPVKQ